MSAPGPLSVFICEHPRLNSFYHLLPSENIRSSIIIFPIRGLRTPGFSIIPLPRRCQGTLRSAPLTASSDRRSAKKKQEVRYGTVVVFAVVAAGLGGLFFSTQCPRPGAARVGVRRGTGYRIPAAGAGLRPAGGV